MRETAGKRGIEFVIEGVLPHQEEIRGNDFVFGESHEKKSFVCFHKLAPDILEEAVRLREKAILVFPHSQMHLKKCPQLLLRLSHANDQSLALRLPDGAVRRIVHSVP